MLMEQIITEMQNPALAQTEILISYLKIFLITVSRLKDVYKRQVIPPMVIPLSDPQCPLNFPTI